MEYEYRSFIDYQGVIYSNVCDHCGGIIHGTAVVLPPAKKIFCDDDCAACWFAGSVENINSIKEDEEPCIPS